MKIFSNAALKPPRAMDRFTDSAPSSEDEDDVGVTFLRRHRRRYDSDSSDAGDSDVVQNHQLQAQTPTPDNTPQPSDHVSNLPTIGELAVTDKQRQEEEYDYAMLVATLPSNISTTTASIQPLAALSVNSSTAPIKVTATAPSRSPRRRTRKRNKDKQKTIITPDNSLARPSAASMNPHRQLYDPRKPTAPIAVNAHAANGSGATTISMTTPSENTSIYVGRHPLRGLPIYKTAREIEQEMQRNQHAHTRRCSLPVESSQRSRPRRSRIPDNGMDNSTKTNDKMAPIRELPSRRPDLATSVEQMHRTIRLIEKELIQHKSLLDSHIDLKSHFGSIYSDHTTLISIGKDDDNSYIIAQLKQLCTIYLDACVANVSMAEEADLLGRLWRVVVHRVINELRANVKYAKKTEAEAHTVTFAQHRLAGFLDFAKALWERILTNIKSQEQQQNTMSDGQTFPPKWAKCLSILGDISRYQATAISMSTTSPSNTSGDRQSPQELLAHAKAMYRWSLYLLPDDGKCYNQLGLIALSEKREFDAVYFYLRSLSASTPFPARESLLSVLAATRKRFPDALKDTKTPKGHILSLQKQLQAFSSNAIFIALLYMLVTRTELDTFDELLKVYYAKFNEALSLGKPATTLKDIAAACQHYFRLAISAIAVFDNLYKSRSADADALTAPHILAHRLVFCLLQAVMSHVTPMFLNRESSISNNVNPFLVFVHVVLAWCAVNNGWDALLFIMCDDPTKSCYRIFQDLTALLVALSSSISDNDNGDAHNLRLVVGSTNFAPADVIITDRVPLPEEQELAGFAPLALLFSSGYYHHIEPTTFPANSSTNHATDDRPDAYGFNAMSKTNSTSQDHYRSRKLLELAWLVTKRTPYLLYLYDTWTFACSPEILAKDEDQRHLNEQLNGQPRGKVARLVDMSAKQQQQQKQRNIELEVAEENVPSYDSYDPFIGNDDEEEEIDETIAQLKQRHQRLQDYARQQPQRTDITHWRLTTSSCIIFDTNCFTRSFGLVRRIIEDKHCIVSVPLAVVQELQGLTKSTNSFSALNAQKSLDYLNKHLNQSFNDDDVTTNNRLLRAQTSRGNWVYDLSIASKEAFELTMASSPYHDNDHHENSNINHSNEIIRDNNGVVDNSLLLTPTTSTTMSPRPRRGWNMDDVILTCCLAVDTITNGSSMSSATAIIVPVVLVTEDANLRLKAHARGVAVVNMTNELDILLRNSFGKRSSSSAR